MCASHLFRIKFDFLLNQLRLKILKLLKSEIYIIKGNNFCFTDAIKSHRLVRKQKISGPVVLHSSQKIGMRFD